MLICNSVALTECCCIN